MLSEPIDMATTPSFFGTLRSFAKRQHGLNEQPDFAVTKVRGYLFFTESDRMGEASRGQTFL